MSRIRPVIVRRHPTNKYPVNTWKLKDQLDATDWFLYCKIYCSLNMFRTPLCPSSGAQELYRWLLPVVLGVVKTENVICKFIHSFHWHVQNAVIPCRSQELLPFFPIIYFFLPLFSANYASILPHFVLPSVSWSTSWSCFQIHTQYSFGNSIFFHSLYVSTPT